MCGRYSFVPSKPQLDQIAGLERPADLILNFNIAPTQQAYVTTNREPRLLQTMQWGLVPFWSRDGRGGGKLINARAEGIAGKASFREPVRKRHCLVWADSFYEWRAAAGGRKIPYRILRTDGRLLCFAGVWDEWRQGDRPLRTFSIITTEPNAEMIALHDRMPVLLPFPADQERWLSDQPLDDALDQLRPAPDGFLTLYRVSEKLNSPANNGPEMHESLPDDPTIFNATKEK